GASVILKQDVAFGAAEIKRFVAERLPSYAVPQEVVERAGFPRTGTGKIDRRALQKMAVDSG
ncbi:MAG: o-succinylbenzoate--CoA ligase, partial [Cyanobacteria bacterium J06560_6]